MLTIIKNLTKSVNFYIQIQNKQNKKKQMTKFIKIQSKINNLKIQNFTEKLTKSVG